MINAAQIRAARALLGWRQEKLAASAEVGLATVRRLEGAAGLLKGNVATIVRLRSALERAGVHFIDQDESKGPGVRLKSRDS